MKGFCCGRRSAPPEVVGPPGLHGGGDRRRGTPKGALEVKSRSGAGGPRDCGCGADGVPPHMGHDEKTTPPPGPKVGGTVDREPSGTHM